MENKTCLVTGVAGFIGSHLAERLLAEGQEVIGVDGFTDYYPRPIKERNLENLRGQERFTFVEGDLMSLDLVALFRGEVPPHLRLTQPGENSAGVLAAGPVEYVFHCAAQPGVRASWGSDFAGYIRNNVLATQRLLEVASSFPLKKFLYSSSSSVYGDAESFPTSERILPQPLSPYGVTKLAGEQLCLLYGRNFGVPVVSLRYFTVYGPKQRPEMAFHRFLRAMLQGDELVVYGTGEQTRDFTYVQDAVEGNILAARSEVVGEVINIGGGSQVTLNQVIGNLETLFQCNARLRYTEAQKGDVKDTAADITKAQQLLGYEPQVTLLEGLARQLAWMKSLSEPSVEPPKAS